jgi:radical SAM protein with 4Fe4S-binding SPASM domain
MQIDKAQEYLNRRISPQEPYADLLNFPRFLEIETVNACNARCPMCTIADWKRNGSPMEDELFYKIAAEVIEHAREVRRVTLYRDGEPLLDKKMASRIAFLKNGGIKSTSLSTNVSLLSESTSRELLEAGLDIIIMSIDSLKKEAYEKIRKGLKFEEVMGNAVRFIALRDKIRPQTQIWMRMIRQKDNLAEWPQYQKYWRSLLGGSDRVYYHNIFNWGGQLSGFEPVAESLEPFLPCVALWSLMVIFSNGDVPLCNTDYNHKYPLGNVASSTIQALWQSKLMQDRRQLHLDGKKACIDICRNCNVWDESPDKENISLQYVEQER